MWRAKLSNFFHVTFATMQIGWFMQICSNTLNKKRPLIEVDYLRLVALFEHFPFYFCSSGDCSIILRQQVSLNVLRKDLEIIYA